MQNDEDEDENTITATRFPCMPSLVALQYMRNRLHLAYLGRKLMKWTAMATGRELRKIAMTLNMIYSTFCDDMNNAFLLLARGRYFYPNLNKMVLENVANSASVTVNTTTKSRGGVKLVQYDLFESGTEPYEHLGIEKGGQQIHEAKLAWLQLLRRLILMLELRVSFNQVDGANRNATKRMNVVSKVVVPRTIATLHYIMTELEEMEREESFRFKKILAVKLKHKNLKKKQDEKNKKKDKIEEEPKEHIQEIHLEIPKEILKEIPDEKPEVLEAIISEILESKNNLNNDILSLSSLESFTKAVNELTDSVMKSSKRSDEDLINKRNEGIEYLLSDALMKELCDHCLKTIEEKLSGKVMKVPSVILTEKSQERIESLESIEDKVSIKEKHLKIKEPDETSNHKDLELGVFETEYQKITTIIRSKREDGTITEERKIIKRKIENRNPIRNNNNKSHKKTPSESSYESSKSSRSNTYSGSRTIGTATVKNKSAFSVKKNTRSETLMYIPTMIYPTVRYSISSRTLSSTNGYDFYCVTLFESKEGTSSGRHTKNESSNASAEFEIKNINLPSRLSSTSKDTHF